MKEAIYNRKKQKIIVLPEISKKDKELVFIMHGMGCNKDELGIKTIAKAFKKNNYTTIRFDTTNTFGESYGKYEDATITNHYEDLEDVINWASKFRWYKEPFTMAGHSTGGLCTMLFAENFPSKVKAIAPVSTIISSSLTSEIYTPEILKKWEEEGMYKWKEEGITKKLKWAFIEDALKYDALKKIDLLAMPVLIISGENDMFSPVRHQKILYEKIPGKKDLKIINKAPHIFTEKSHLDEIENLFDNWIKSLN